MSRLICFPLLAAALCASAQTSSVDPSETAIAYARRRALPAMSFAVAVAQDLNLPDASYDVVTCTLAIHHIPARKREAAFREMYRVTKPGGRLLAADFDPARRPFPLHAGPLEELATAAGYQIQASGRLPLLRYVLAVRPA